METPPLPSERGEGASSGPVEAPSRIASLDVLRGFALLGILVMNVQSFSMPTAAYVNPTAWGDLTGANGLVWLVSHLLADEKMMAIFSMLFGAGIVLFADRIESRGDSPVRLHLRRTVWLLVFGALHAYLLWYGDILFLYAVCALAIFWLRGRSPRRLLILGVAVLSVSSAVHLLAGASMDYWPPEERAAFTEHVWDPPPERLDEEMETYRGGWSDQMRERAPMALLMQTLLLAADGFWRAAGLMLIGMALFKLGVFHATRPDSFYWKLVAAGGLVGLPVVAYGVWWNFAGGWEPISFFHGTQFNYWGSVLVSLGWVGAVMLACRRGAFQWLTDRLAAVGRTAFSNYILQTLICVTIFYGHGFGMFGGVERVGQAGVVLTVWAIQLAVSPLWLRRFRFGPLEWLWRSLTYRKMQPFRRR